MTIHILKMDNPKHPTDKGLPTRIRLIGPFETEESASEFACDPLINPHDNPCWQLVDIDDVALRAGVYELNTTDPKSPVVPA